MDDGTLLLEAIRVSPAEDTPRLAFADYLDELGGDANCAWAEFIRADTLLPRRHVSQELFDRALPASWCIDFDPGDHDGALVHWHRGFVDSVSMPTPEFLKHAGAIFSRHPVAEVKLTDKAPAVGEGGLRGWEFIIASAPARLHDIPVDLWRELIPRRPDEQIEFHGWYDSYALALAALSQACVLWGKRAAVFRRASGRQA